MTKTFSCKALSVEQSMFRRLGCGEIDKSELSIETPNLNDYGVRRFELSLSVLKLCLFPFIQSVCSTKKWIAESKNCTRHLKAKKIDGIKKNSDV